MTVLSRVNFSSQQRLDLTHVLASDSFAANDFRAMTSFFTGLDKSYVVSGLEAVGKAGLTITLKVSSSVIFNAMDSSGAFYFARPDDADVNLALPYNTAAVYVQARFVTMTQAQVNQAYWNPLAITGDSAAGNEYTASTDSQVVSVLEISNNTSGFSVGSIPILKCATQASAITGIVDCRPLFFRLGTGGAIPDAYAAFPWAVNRAEPVAIGDGVGQDATSSFRSTNIATIENDKGITTFKQWMDAVMTRLSELAGSPLWYDSSLAHAYVSNLDLNRAYLDSDAGHSINADEDTVFTWRHDFKLASRGANPVAWQANFGALKWYLGGTFTSSSNHAYSNHEFLSPDVVGDGKNLYLVLQREAQVEWNRDLSWGAAPAGSTFTANQSVSGSGGDFTGIAVGDYVRKVSEGMSLYHRVNKIWDGSAKTTDGLVASGAATGLELDAVVATSTEALRWFRSRYCNTDLATDNLAPIQDADSMWIGRRTGEFFMLRRFGTMYPGEEIAIFDNINEPDSGFGAWEFGAASPYYTVGGVFTLTAGGLGRIHGQEISWQGGQTVAMPANGSFGYVYITELGVLSITATANDALYHDNIVLFEVFVDTVGVPFVAKENHAYSFNTDVSRYLHNNVGTVIRGLGADVAVVTVGTGSVATDREVKIAADDTVDDHGLITTITAANPITWKFMYRTAGSWKLRSTSTDFPAQYNNAGTLAALNTSGAGSATVFTLYVVKDDCSGTPQYLAVYDEASYQDITHAQNAIDAGTTTRASAALLALEPCQLGYVLFQHNLTSGFIDHILIDKYTFNSKIVGGGNEGFAGLVATTNENFDAMLSGADVTIQHALDTIDEYAKDSSFKIQNVADATKVFSVDAAGITTGIKATAQIANPGMTSVGAGDIILGSTVKPLAAGTWTLTKYDRVIATGLSASAPTDLILPLAPTNGTPIVVKDVGMTASKYPVVVSASGAETIEGCPGAYVLCEDGVSVTFEYNQGNWAVRTPSKVSSEAKQLSATASPSWDSVDIGYEAIATSVTTANTVAPSDLGSTKGRALELLPADYVQGLVFKRPTTFTGVGTLGMQVGNGVTVDKYLASVNVIGISGGKTAKPAAMESVISASQLIATFTGDVALNNLTTGAVQLNVLKSNLIGVQGSRSQPSWKKFVINYKDVAALGANLTGTIALPVRFGGSCVTGVAVRSTRAFVGLTLPTIIVNVGSTATVSGFAPTAAGASSTYDIFQVTGPKTALAVNVAWSSSNQLLNASDGELEVYVQVSQYEVPADNLFSSSTAIKNPTSTPTWQKFSVASSAFAAFATGVPQTLNVCPIYGDEIVHAIFFKHRVAFAGLSNIRASIGDGVLTPAGTVVASNTASYLANFNIDSVVAEATFPTPYNTVIFDLFDSSSRMLQVSLTAAANGSLSAGMLDIYVLKSKLASK